MKKPHGSTEKGPATRPRTTRGKRAELLAWIECTHPVRIGESEFGELLRVLAPISEGYLRSLLRKSGVPLAPMVDGVRQGSLDELEDTLNALLDEYEGGDTARKNAVRRLVITAKDHAKWAARRATTPDHKQNKEEMILWLMTWLENPPLFPQWVKLRRAQCVS